MKLSKMGSGAPSREPQLDDVAQAKLMRDWHRRQEDLVSYNLSYRVAKERGYGEVLSL